MKIWLPYIRSGSGTDVFTEILASALSDFGCQTVTSPVDHHWQFFPWGMPYLTAPVGTDITLVNSWNGFMFRRPGIKQVVVEHLCVHDPAMRPYRNFAQAIFHNIAVQHFEKESFRTADAVVAVSEDTAAAVRAIFGATRVAVIHNGIDTSFFCPASAPAAPDFTRRPVRLLFVGNLIRRKGADLLPRIMSKLGPGYELHYTSGLRAKRKFVASPNMKPMGRLDREQVLQAYRWADMLLFPTRLEGFGYAAAEAMACGIPVVASDTTALPEVVTDGVTGRLCPVDDVGAFVEAIRSLAGHPDQLAAMAQNARTVVLERFTLDSMVRKYISLFSALLDIRSPTPSVLSNS